MPIPVTCQCGARFAAKDEMAGTRAKCPKCQAVLTIPAAGAATAAPKKTAPKAQPAVNSVMADLLDDAGFTASKTGQRCPSCHKDMKQGAKICLECGFNTETGKKLETKVEVAVERPPPGASSGARGGGGGRARSEQLNHNYNPSDDRVALQLFITGIINCFSPILAIYGIYFLSQRPYDFPRKKLAVIGTVLHCIWCLITIVILVMRSQQGATP